MSRKFNTETNIADLNRIRINSAGSVFTDTSLKEMLKESGIISNDIFLHVLCRSDIFDKTHEGLYCFRSPDKPVHINKLEQIYKEYREKLNLYRKNWKNKRKEKDVMERPDIQAAIRLLKENGMEVFRRIE